MSVVRKRPGAPTLRARGVVCLLARPVAWLLITALPAQAVPYVPAPRVGNSAEGNGFVEGPHPQTPAPRSFGIGGGGSGNGARARRERASSVWPGALGVALSRDELGNRVRQIDANDHATAFEYDRLGREIKRLLPAIGTADPAFETKSYDDAGNLESRTDFAGRVTAYTYDVMNRLLARTAQCAPIPCAGAADASFTYTPSGRRETVTDARGVTEYEYNDRDRLQSLTYPDGRKLEYLYDGNGNRTTLTATIPAVGGGSPTVLTTAYTYDDANRLDLVTDTAGRTYDHGYDLNGNRTTLAQPNGTLTEYVYNTLNRLTNLSTTHAGLGTTIQSYGLTLGPAGNRERIDEADGTSRIYTYDDLYRLTSDTVTIAGLNQYAKTFVYDDVGNRQTQTTTIGPAGSPGPVLQPGTLAYAYDERDRLTTETLDVNPPTAYGWDADGNFTTKSAEATYTWDRENRLVRVEKTDGTVVAHTYDTDGARVQTITTPSGGSAATTNFLVDTSGSLSHVVAETNAAGSLAVHYVRGDDLLALVRPLVPAPASAADWQTRYYHSDHTGSVRRLTNETGQVTDGYTYTAFGELLAHTGTDPQPYAFTGEPYDPNVGFQYHRARWMDPRVGRFVGMDPFEGLQHEPLTLHKYLYAGADPGNKIDPSGLMTLPELAIVAAIITGLISASITAYRGGSPAEIVTAGVVTGLAAGVVVYGGVPLLIAGGSVTAGLVAIGRHAGVNVALQFANVIRQVGVRLSATGTPPTPNGMSLPQFGTQVMQWGTGAQAALQRIASLTPEQLRAAGVTVEIAARWRDFYINVAMRNPANTSAVGRAVLMHHAAMLLE